MQEDNTQLVSPAPTAAKTRFRLLANVIMAMNRFTAALNPEIHFEKKRSSGSGLPPTALLKSGSQGRTRTTSGRAASGRTISGRDPEHNVGKHHGYKGNLLAKPLPPLASEQETTVNA